MFLSGCLREIRESGETLQYKIGGDPACSSQSSILSVHSIILYYWLSLEHLHTQERLQSVISPIPCEFINYLSGCRTEHLKGETQSSYYSTTAANTIRWPDAFLMLAQRLRRWANIKKHRVNDT